MKKSIHIFILIAIILCSCNEKENKTTPKEIKTDKVTSKELKVNISFKTDKDDVFRIMVNNIEVDELQKKNIQVFETVAPSSNFENIEANFGENISKDIIIHLGNKSIKQVEIKSLYLSYGNKNVGLTTAQDLTNNIIHNKFIERDSSNNIFRSKRIEGKLNPTIRIKKSLINSLMQD